MKIWQLRLGSFCWSIRCGRMWIFISIISGLDVDPETGQYFYNDREHLFVEEGVELETYFEYVNPDHILSMSFEGPVCEMLYYGMYPAIRKKFDAIFARYGLYYEFGHHWNFSCYYI